MRPRVFGEYVGTYLHLGIRCKCDVPTDLDVRGGHERGGGVRELNRALGDVPDVRNGCEIVGGEDLEESHFDAFGHDVPFDREDIRRFCADVEV